MNYQEWFFFSSFSFIITFFIFDLKLSHVFYSNFAYFFLELSHIVPHLISLCFILGWLLHLLTLSHGWFSYMLFLIFVVNFPVRSLALLIRDLMCPWLWASLWGSFLFVSLGGQGCGVRYLLLYQLKSKSKFKLQTMAKYLSLAFFFLQRPR